MFSGTVEMFPWIVDDAHGSHIARARLARAGDASWLTLRESELESGYIPAVEAPAHPFSILCFPLTSLAEMTGSIRRGGVGETVLVPFRECSSVELAALPGPAHTHTSWILLNRLMFELEDHRLQREKQVSCYFIIIIIFYYFFVGWYYNIIPPACIYAKWH